MSGRLRGPSSGVPAVPVTVLHGDDGELVSRYHDAGAVVVVPDKVIGERSPGCPCCQVRLDVIDALRSTVERRFPPRSVVLVLQPEDDAATAVQTVLSDPDLQRLVALDGVTVALDGVATATRLALGLPLAEGVGAVALGVADQVFVRRHDSVMPAARTAIAAEVGRVNGLARPFAGAGLVAAWHGVPHLQPTEDVASGFADRLADIDPTARVGTVVCAAEAPLDPEAIDAWLAGVVGQYGARLLRLQGALAVHGHEERVCCQAVRSFATSHSEGRRGHVRSGSSTVAVVGVGLDADDLRSSFLATVA